MVVRKERDEDVGGPFLSEQDKFQVKFGGEDPLETRVVGVPRQGRET